MAGSCWVQRGWRLLRARHTQLYTLTQSHCSNRWTSSSVPSDDHTHEKDDLEGGGSDHSTHKDNIPLQNHPSQSRNDETVKAIITREELRSLLKNIQKPKSEPLESEPKVYRTSPMTVEELVEFLQNENARDICVIHLPPEKDYVSFFVTCTGLGVRHLGRMADNLVAEIKKVRLSSSNRKINVEGRESDDWMVVDMGSIVVHFLTEEGRNEYELEKLWTLGPQYDDQYRDILKTIDTLKL